MTNHYCSEENAAKMAEWIRTRGGVAVWQSINLSNLDQSWSTPLHDESGHLTKRPNWQCSTTPSRGITSSDHITVTRSVEVKRFHVAIRRSTNGLQYKLRDGSSKRVRAAVGAAGEGAHYEFDYMSQEAVIMKPLVSMTLTEWENNQMMAKTA